MPLTYLKIKIKVKYFKENKYLFTCNLQITFPPLYTFIEDMYYPV